MCRLARGVQRHPNPACKAVLLSQLQAGGCTLPTTTAPTTPPRPANHHHDHDRPRPPHDHQLDHDHRTSTTAPRRRSADHDHAPPCRSPPAPRSTTCWGWPRTLRHRPAGGDPSAVELPGVPLHLGSSSRDQINPRTGPVCGLGRFASRRQFAVSGACPIDCALIHKGMAVGLQDREQGEQGELYRGFGDSLSRSFELALTPPIFAGFGYSSIVSWASSLSSPSSSFSSP